MCDGNERNIYGYVIYYTSYYKVERAHSAAFCGFPATSRTIDCPDCPTPGSLGSLNFEQTTVNLNPAGLPGGWERITPDIDYSMNRAEIPTGEYSLVIIMNTLMFYFLRTAV